MTPIVDEPGPPLPHDSPRPRPAARLPLVGEALVPWLAGAVFAATVNLVVIVLGVDVSAGEQAVLLVLLCVVLAVAGLVTARSDRDLAPSIEAERARPAAEELQDQRVAIGSQDYLTGMRDWVAAVAELLGHALQVAPADDPAARELTAAADDAEAVLELLDAAAEGPLSLGDRATLHAVCTLWETNQATIERTAARLDRPWHRRWRARSVVATRLRHGAPEGEPLMLPFRA